MSDEMMFTINDDGVATLYNDTYDVVIHCESESDQKKVVEKLKGTQWIPCSERLPEMGKTVLWCNKHGSVFVSSITFKAEKCEYFTVGKHFDVVAWQPLPEPYKEAEHDES